MTRVERVRAQPAAAAGYDDDFFAWTQRTAALLRARRLDEVDLEHVADEVEDMGKRGSWRGTIRTQRTRLELVLQDSPSLHRQLEAMLARRWPKAVALAADPAGLAVERLPASCPYAVEQILDDEFLPS